MQITLVFSLLFSPFVVATPVRSLQSRATVTIAGYDYAGCYTEATSMRAFSGLSYYDDAMTIEKCAAACSGYAWFGAEYGRECYCGSAPNTGSVEVQEAYCNFPCPGNSAEICGSGGHLTTYAKTGILSSTSSSISTYGSLGCYTEATTGRALSSAAFANDAMTVEMCASECLGFTMFGVEYQRECYCGNTLNAGSVATSQLDCKYSCMGNQSESCGGDSRLNLYQFGATSITPTVVTEYGYQGCYTEATGIRALTAKAYFNDSMTVEACANACIGYTWFGVEYGRECYCGNTINSGSVVVDESNCSFSCPGDSTEKCGAGDLLNMYEFGAPAATLSASSSTSISSATSTSTSSIQATLLSSSSSVSILSSSSTSPTQATPLSSSISFSSSMPISSSSTSSTKAISLLSSISSSSSVSISSSSSSATQATSSFLSSAMSTSSSSSSATQATSSSSSSAISTSSSSSSATQAISSSSSSAISTSSSSSSATQATSSSSSSAISTSSSSSSATQAISSSSSSAISTSSSSSSATQAISSSSSSAISTSSPSTSSTSSTSTVISSTTQSTSSSSILSAPPTTTSNLSSSITSSSTQTTGTCLSTTGAFLVMATQQATPYYLYDSSEGITGVSVWQLASAYSSGAANKFTWKLDSNGNLMLPSKIPPYVTYTYYAYIYQPSGTSSVWPQLQPTVEGNSGVNSGGEAYIEGCINSLTYELTLNAGQRTQILDCGGEMWLSYTNLGSDLTGRPCVQVFPTVIFTS